jgi:hypothetical protein
MYDVYVRMFTYKNKAEVLLFVNSVPYNMRKYFDNMTYIVYGSRVYYPYIIPEGLYENLSKYLPNISVFLHKNFRFNPLSLTTKRTLFYMKKMFNLYNPKTISEMHKISEEVEIKLKHVIDSAYKANHNSVRYIESLYLERLNTLISEI